MQLRSSYFAKPNAKPAAWLGSFVVVLTVFSGFSSCVSTPGATSAASGSDEDDVLAGTIAYPFVDETKTLGRDEKEEKFIIRSAVGNKEYSIEIPGAARDYDVQVPLADIGESDGDVISGRKPQKLGSPVQTDKEVLATLPRLEQGRATDAALMDSAFGAGTASGPKQAPSYTLGLAKINELFKRHQFEFALVEINNEISFYPNSPQLYKMKGTVLAKMRNLPLAELAWIRALQLDPNDKGVRTALERLQRRIVAQGQAVAAPDGSQVQRQQQAIPSPVGTAAPKDNGALTH